MSAWQTFKRLHWKLKVLVVVGAPLWIPVAIAAHLERKWEA